MKSVASSSYQKVPHVGSRLFTTDRMYYNAQHVLVVESGYFQDTYRKIAFSDVCGFSICESKRALAWGIVWIAVAIVFGIFCFTTDFKVPALIVLAGIAVVALIINIALGQSYCCTLSTAFSDVLLKTITRKRKALLFKAFLDEKVSAAQGLLTQEEARELIESKLERARQSMRGGASEAVTSEGSPLAEPDAASVLLEQGEAGDEIGRSEAPPPLPASAGLAKRHWAFSILLGALGLSFLGNYVFSWYSWAITGLIFAVSMVVSIFASIRKVDTEQGASLRTVFNMGIGFHFVVAIVGYVLMMGNVYSDPSSYDANPFGMYELEGPVASYLFLGSGIFSLVLSAIAAVKMLRFNN